MRTILAAAAAATVAAMSVGPSPTYTLTANVLTLNGYTFGNTIEWDVDDIFQGSLCSEQSGNTCTEVRYLDGAPEVPAEVTGLIALQWALLTTPPPTTVLGFSQGATIASNWIKQNAGIPFAPSPENLSFVLAANPNRKYGGIRSDLGIDTPTPDSEYSVVDIAIEYDGAADFPDDLLNILAVANALAGFQYVHIFGYADVDLENDEKLTWVEGNTTYVLIRRENIPLLEPLRILGLTELADSLNGPLKEIIDRAYDRDYPGLAETASQRSAAQQLSADGDVEATDDTFVAETASPDAQSAESSSASTRVQVDTDVVQEGESDSSPTDLDEEATDGDAPQSSDEEATDGATADDDTVADGIASDDSADADEDTATTAGSSDPESAAGDESGSDSADDHGADSANDHGADGL